MKTMCKTTIINISDGMTNSTF